jgi:multicomponent Na+:H+ antiporter subunit E
VRIGVRVPAFVIWLTALWVALWDDLSWANLLSGLLVATAVAAVARIDLETLRPTYFRPVWATWYVVVLLRNLVAANLRLAWEILTPGIGTHTGIVAVPMRGGSEAVVNLVANSITLTPGTMTVEVSTSGDLDHDGAEDDVLLYIHGMYTRDAEAVRRDVLHLEELALRAFGTPADYARAHEAFVVQDELVRRTSLTHRDVTGDGG